MDLKIKYKKINRTTYGLSGSVEFFDLTGYEVSRKKAFN